MGDSALRSNGGQRVVALSLAAAGSKERRGVWYYTSDSAYRFMAVVAGHAPNYRAWTRSYIFTPGSLDADLDSLPRTAAEWKLGEPYAFLIDVLSESTRAPVFRIYFQDAPSEPPLGFPPKDILAEYAVDLAVLCAATSSNISARRCSTSGTTTRGGPARNAGRKSSSQDQQSRSSAVYQLNRD